MKIHLTTYICFLTYDCDIKSNNYFFTLFFAILGIFKKNLKTKKNCILKWIFKHFCIQIWFYRICLLFCGTYIAYKKYVWNRTFMGDSIQKILQPPWAYVLYRIRKMTESLISIFKGIFYDQKLIFEIIKRLCVKNTWIF